MGASSSKRWMNCPASVFLSEGIKGTTSPAAEEGTAAHDLAELCFKKGFPPHTYLGDKINGYEVTDEMAWAVSNYIDTVREYYDEAFDVIKIEEMFTMPFDERLFGTNDACVYKPFDRKLIIIDLKYGKGHAVEALDNSQLKYYALGAVLSGLDADEIELVIAQDRAHHVDGPIRRATITLDELMKFKQEVIEAVKKVDEVYSAKDPYKYAKAGEHCYFCNAAGFCKTLKEKSLQSAMVEFDDVLDEPTLVDPKTLTKEQIAKALDLSKMVERWITAVKEYAEENLAKGQKIPGYKLVQKRGTRKWTDEEKSIEELRDIFGDEILTVKLKTPSQLEKTLGKKLTEKLTYKQSTGLTLAPESDRRKGTTPAALDFDDLP